MLDCLDFNTSFIPNSLKIRYLPNFWARMLFRFAKISAHDGVPFDVYMAHTVTAAGTYCL